MGLEAKMKRTMAEADAEAKKRRASPLVGEEFEATQQNYLDQLLRMLSTVGAQQSNRASEFAAYQRANLISL